MSFSMARSKEAFDTSSSWFRASSLRTRQRAGVLDGLEGPLLGVGVGPHLAGLGVGDGDRRFDVGETSGEDPEVLVEGATVEDLDDGLDVGGGEEPEVAGVVGQLHGLGLALGAAGRLEGCSDLEAAALQAHGGGGRYAVGL